MFRILAQGDSKSSSEHSFLCLLTFLRSIIYRLQVLGYCLHRSQDRQEGTLLSFKHDQNFQKIRFVIVFTFSFEENELVLLIVL